MLARLLLHLIIRLKNFAREVDMEIICTAENPWDHVKRKGVRIIHPDAKEGQQHDGYPAGDYVEYECPNCGKKFEVELPQ